MTTQALVRPRASWQIMHSPVFVDTTRVHSEVLVYNPFLESGPAHAPFSVDPPDVSFRLSLFTWAGEPAARTKAIHLSPGGIRRLDLRDVLPERFRGTFIGNGFAEFGIDVEGFNPRSSGYFQLRLNLLDDAGGILMTDHARLQGSQDELVANGEAAIDSEFDTALFVSCTRAAGDRPVLLTAHIRVPGGPKLSRPLATLRTDGSCVAWAGDLFPELRDVRSALIGVTQSVAGAATGYHMKLARSMRAMLRP